MLRIAVYTVPFIYISIMYVVLYISEWYVLWV